MFQCSPQKSGLRGTLQNPLRNPLPASFRPRERYGRAKLPYSVRLMKFRFGPRQFSKCVFAGVPIPYILNPISNSAV